MKTVCSATKASPLGVFERYLSVCVALAMLGGTLLGNLAPAPFATLARLEYAHVNLPVAVLIWAMIFPMMVSIDFAAVRRVGDAEAIEVTATSAALCASGLAREKRS
jgi:ACR3 family arsenite transporter